MKKAVMIVKQSGLGKRMMVCTMGKQHSGLTIMNVLTILVNRMDLFQLNFDEQSSNDCLTISFGGTR